MQAQKEAVNAAVVGQERVPKTLKAMIRSFSHHTREDAGIRPYSAHTSLGPSSQISLEDPKALFIFSGYGSCSSRRQRAARKLTLTLGLETIHISPKRDILGQIKTLQLGSFQNVLLSVTHFRELTGAYQARITVVGHNFKRHRSEQLYQCSLCWPQVPLHVCGYPAGG
ncbi:hypothetical protein H4582DRAFT_2073280 [Lactarius indigo]|nr:hypothetical protein H4582DRAFT_2073280 [Lactarius indigo]